MGLLDPKWKYTHSTATDIRKTFAKERKRLDAMKKADAQRTQSNFRVSQFKLSQRST
jgi:hypothetical protein